MHWSFWVLAALCLGLMAALAAALCRLYELMSRREPSAGAGRLPQGWEKLDELLSMLLALQERGVSRSGEVSREDFGRAVLESACSLMKCGRGTVMVWDEDAGCLRVVAARSPRSDKSRSLSLKPGEGVAGKAFVSGQPIFIEDPGKDPRYVQGGGPDSEPFISLPLLVKSKPIGVLNLHATGDPEPFNDYNIKFLNILAGEAAVMLHNLDLLDSLETFYLEMVKTLARAVDLEDAAAHERSDRAGLSARRLAAELGLPEPMARYVEYAALLHDIGKIGIDRTILSKPGKLSPEELEAVKKHPVIAHQILAPVKFLGPVAQMVLYHQEWFDGRGYPEGLKGDEIPLGARLVSVIDAWEAMTSERPYHKALSTSAALAELEDGSGTQFDPKVVRAFLRMQRAEAPA